MVIGHPEYCVMRAPLYKKLSSTIFQSLAGPFALGIIALIQVLLKFWHCQKGQSGLSQSWQCRDFEGAWFQYPFLRIMTRDEKFLSDMNMVLGKGKVVLINGGKFL